MPARLPNPDRARIDPRKLRDYALNPPHISGRHKAAFFYQMGYSESQWTLLEEDIRAQHVHKEAEIGRPSPYGQKYSITAPLVGPSGVARQVMTVWIVRGENDFAELVTIEPASRQK